MDASKSLTKPQAHNVDRELAQCEYGRVLIIESDLDTAARIHAVLKARTNITVEITDSITAADQLIVDHEYDLVICAWRLGLESDWKLISHTQQPQTHTRAIVIGQRAHYSDAMSAIRAGADDYLTEPADSKEATARIWKAFDEAVRDRQKEASICRLRRICKRLNSARLDVTTQIDDLCTDLVQAYDELAGQISHVTTITEFTAIIRQELDVEDLLRTTLEYFLRRIGPMNAAVFLPGHADEFTLGAYINYDCPKDSADFMLDQLADVIPGLMQDETRVLEFSSNAEIEKWLGDDAHWLDNSHVVCFTCRHEGECLAVFTLFRNNEMPFDAQFVPMMEAVAEVFGEQLAHVIHVHHRALPLDRDDDDDDADGDWLDDLAA